MVCTIKLNSNSDKIYHPNSVIRGHVNCHFDKETVIKLIKVTLYYKEHNLWVETETYVDIESEITKIKPIIFSGIYRKIIQEIQLVEATNGHLSLGPGIFLYPFQFTLPGNIPSSFEDFYGNIRYYITATIESPIEKKEENNVIIAFKSPIVMEDFPLSFLTPVCLSDEEVMTCWCCNSGIIELDVKLPKFVFIPGESVPIELKLTNMSRSNVNKIYIGIYKMVIHKGTSPYKRTITNAQVILELERSGVKAHNERTYNLDLLIPDYLQVPNFINCNLFSIEYVMTITAKTSRFSSDFNVNMKPYFANITSAQWIEGQNQISKSLAINPPSRENPSSLLVKECCKHVKFDEEMPKNSECSLPLCDTSAEISSVPKHINEKLLLSSSLTTT